ncbi:MAG: GH3 auxin-responsive promoter family protein [Clostridium sp.]|nr:GH3 auxin-responsive promoter family protein [Clostridium sp.]
MFDDAVKAEKSQRAVLDWLIGKGVNTQWGAAHGLRKGMNYEEYRKVVPVIEYEEIRTEVMRMVNGEADVLWPGVCRRFAQSSGTSGGKSKFIPVTKDSLDVNHYPGASAPVAFYLDENPASRMFSGKGLILGGSFANELASLPAGVKVGDLSANLIDAINPLVGLFRVPGKKIALMADWKEKLPALAHAVAKENVTNISGVPSWMLTVLKRILEDAGKTNISDIWPNLEVFFHGGIAFAPYAREYREIMPIGMNYVETYNASEGFFGTQIEYSEKAMMLLAKQGVFYEFVPLEQVGEAFPEDAVPLWGVELGRTYALVISACNGLWRYAIGDTVMVDQRHPVMITIAGRTKSYINAFGEELMVHNAEAAIAKACAAQGCAIANYTAAPVYASGKRRGRHQWMIEWEHSPRDLEAFADELDRRLQEENSDYQAKRAGSLFLDRLEIVDAKPGLFDAWLGLTGKLGGQRKVPRLCNDRNIMDKLIELNDNKSKNPNK